MLKLILLQNRYHLPTNFLVIVYSDVYNPALFLCGSEPINDDGSLFKFLPPAPVVLFCKNSPSFKKVVMQSQPIPTKSAP